MNIGINDFYLSGQKLLRMTELPTTILDVYIMSLIKSKHRLATPIFNIHDDQNITQESGDG